MSRRALSRAGACFAVLGGLILAINASMFGAAVLSMTTGWTPSSIMSGRFLALFSVLAISSSAAPVAVLIGLLGLYALVGGGSPAGKWGLAASAFAMIILFTVSMFPYLIFSGNPGSSGPGYVWAMFALSSAFSALQAVLLATGLVLLHAAACRRGVLGPWRWLLPAIGFTAVLTVAAPIVLPELGLPGGSMLGQASAIVAGLMWMALGMAIWRHAPPAERSNASSTAPVSS